MLKITNIGIDYHIYVLAFVLQAITDHKNADTVHIAITAFDAVKPVSLCRNHIAFIDSNLTLLFLKIPKHPTLKCIT